jgi:ABC-type multidrug transport system fused ATPase/permease subunit
VLSAWSLLGGLAEAGILVSVASAAVALVEGASEATLVGGAVLSVGELLAAAVALLGVRVFSGVMAASATARITAGVVSRTRQELATAYFGADWATAHAGPSGRLQELLTSFSNQGAILINGIVRLAVAAVNLLALIAVAAVVNPLASLAALAVYGLLAVLMSPLRAAVRRESRRYADAELTLSTRVAEFGRLDLETRVFGVERRVEEDVHELIGRSAGVHRRFRRLSELSAPAVTTLLYATIIAALAIVEATGTIDLASVGAVLLILLRSFGYAQVFQAALITLNSTLPFVEKLDDEIARFRAARSATGDMRVDRVPSISLESVSFEYVPGIPALRNVTASLGPGEIVGVVGPSGAGKSTLVHLLLGLRRPTSGRVLVADRDVTEVHREDWSRLVGFVPQQPHLFAGPVRENIRFFRPEVTDEAVERAARQAQIHDEILRLPGGYDHEIGPRGASLSIGQQQRITIARALVGRPHLLVLDEPTSALDPHSEYSVRKSLDVIREALTIVIVAHRVSTLDICDRIMVIQEGAIQALDTPASLSADAGFYQEILELSGLR